MPRISKKYELSLNKIKFEIAMTFPECDVDSQLANEAQWVPHFHDTKGTATPIEITVAKYIATIFKIYLDDKNMNVPLKDRVFGKAEVCESYGLMHGFCSVSFEVDPNDLEDIAELPKIIEHCKKVMRSHAKIIKYYRDKQTVGHHIGIIGACG